MRKFLKWFKDLFGHYKSKETLQSEAEHREIREAAHRCVGIERPTVLTARDVSLTITDANGNVHKVDGFASDEVRIAMKTSAAGRGEVFSADKLKGRLTVRREAAAKEEMAKAAPVLASKLNQSRAAARVATSRRQYDDPSTDIVTSMAMPYYIATSSSTSSSCSSSSSSSSYDSGSYDSGSSSCD